MNFISNMAMPVVSFLSEPFYSAFQIGFKLRSLENTDSEISKENIKSIEKDAIPIPSNLEKRIIEFISEEIGIDTSNIVFVISHDSHYETQYSIKHDGLAYLRISSEMLQEMEVEFSNTHKFSLAHEIGHIMAEDCYNRATFGNIKASLMRIAAYLASSLALSTLFSTSYAGIISGQLLNCAIAKTAGFIYENWTIRNQEILADEFAMKISPSIAQGGIDEFKAIQMRNLITRNYQIKSIAEEINSVNGIGNLPVKCSLFTDFGRRLIAVSDEGELRYDFEHPPLSQRIKRIEDYLSINL